jgi:hypothetical protein
LMFPRNIDGLQSNANNRALDIVEREFSREYGKLFAAPDHDEKERFLT